MSSSYDPDDVFGIYVAMNTLACDSEIGQIVHKDLGDPSTRSDLFIRLSKKRGRKPKASAPSS